MEIPSSPSKNEIKEEKKKVNDNCNIINEQIKAVEEARAFPLRKFRLETVTVDTLSGEPLMAKMWVTDEDFTKSGRKEKEMYKCEICEKEFDKRQKMLLHQRFHKKQM